MEKAVSYVEGKTDTEVSIGRLFVTFGGNIYLEDLYLEDATGDTLLYSQQLTTGVDFIPLISGNIAISRFEWENAKAIVTRDEQTEKFNFDFLIEAFTSPQGESVPDTQVATDTSTSALSLKIGPVSLKNITAIYKDGVMGIDANLHIGSLDAKIPTIDLEAYEFKISNIELAKSEIQYLQTKPFSPTVEDTVASLLPNIILDKLSISELLVEYVSKPDMRSANVNLGELIVKLPKANLQTQEVELKKLALRNSKIAYHDFSPPSPDSITSDTTVTEDFIWPDWLVHADVLEIVNTSISYKTSDQDTQKGVFHPEVILLDGLNVELTDVFLEQEKAGLAINKFEFTEGSGFQLKDFSSVISLENEGITVNDLLLQTNRSNIDGSIKISYPSIQQLIVNPEGVSLDLAVGEMKADVRDSYFFAPELAQDTLIQEIAKAPIFLTTQAKGDLKNLNIAKLELKWMDTDLQAKGVVKNPTDINNLAFDFPKITAHTSRKTIIKFIDEASLGVKLPENFDLLASASGNLNDLITDLSLETDLGNIALAGNFKNGAELSFDTKLNISTLQLGKILQNENINIVSIILEAKGAGTELNSINATLNSTISQLGLYGHDYSGLKLKGQLENGVGNVHMWLTEKFLDFDLLTNLDLDSTDTKIDLTLDLKGADFFALGMSAKSSRAKMLFKAKFEGNLDEFDLKTTIDDGILVYDQNPYPIGKFALEGSVREDSTTIDITSKILNGFIRTNTNPTNLTSALTGHFRQYLDKSDSTATATQNKIVMKVDMSLADDPLLTEVLVQGLEQFDSAKISVDYIQEKDSLFANFVFPFVKYGGTEIDSLGIRIRTDKEALRLYFGFSNLTSGPLSMDQTFITGQLANSRLYFDFHSYREKDRTYHVSSDIGLDGDTLSYHVSSIDMILNGEEWKIPEKNLVKYSGTSLAFKDFKFTREGQELSMVNNIEGLTEENIAVVFRDFKLSTFTSLLNPEELVADGLMKGKLVVENPFKAMGLIGELQIDSLKVLETPLGNLSLDASAKSLGNYLLGLQLKDDGVDLDLKGNFVADEAGGKFDIELNLNKIEMEKLAGLSQGQLTNASGYLTGKITANGTTTDPKYFGEFQFKETSFVPAQLSTKYILSDEALKIDNDGVYFDSFTFADEDNNTFDINGTVGTESYLNPTFDLTLKAKNFMVINSTDEENDLVYGKATIDADVTVEGDLTLPVVNAKLTLKNNTDLTVLIPETQVDLVEREGIVLFVNKENPDDILTRQFEENTSAFAGYEVTAILNVDPEAILTIVIDPQSGDNLAISGSAALSMNIEPNGRITLSGSYEINDGHYEMSLYNLVSKEFDIDKGSRITWNGDPLDASMDVRAIYTVETGSTELMSAQLTGSDNQSTNQYQQKLPFQVFLNVGGELLRPEISFRLDMPEAQRGAFGGAVYSRVLQINDQEDELNKQVFSLLVLNRFFPSTGSDGSNGGAEAIARNSLSQIFSNQLNNLSSKIFGNSGLSLGFDVDSYNQGSGKATTELNINAQQKLFDDRLLVQVGSSVDVEGSSQSEAQGNSILANISFEYLLTEDGRWRIRAFRKNQFESIIDGQLVVTGAGLIFNREFNQFTEIWKPKEEDPNKTNPIEDLQKKNTKKTKKSKQSKKSEEDEN